MNDLLAVISSQELSARWFEAFSSITMKCSIAAGVALVLVFVLKRGSAANRHLILALAVLSTLLIPAIDTLLPVGYSQYLPSIALGFGTSIVANAPTGAADMSDGHSVHWTSWVMLCWLTGFVIALIRLAYGMRETHAAIRNAEPLSSRHLDRIVLQCKTSLGIRRRIDVRLSDEDRSPFSVGWLRPSIVLPQAAAGWDEECIRIVILHELAHIKRADIIFDRAAKLSRAMYWFNPLIWVAVRRLKAERERAADDCVLSAGADRWEYAKCLVRIARSLIARRRCLPVGLAMAQRFDLDRRIRAIVDSSLLRNPVSRPATLLAGLVTLAVAVSLSGIHARAGDDPTPNSTEAKQDSSEAAGDSLPRPDEFIAVENLPVAVFLAQPDYPAEARSRGVEADVWVKVLVGKRGDVRDAIVAKATVQGSGFEERALESAQKGRWQPALVGGKPVAVWVTYKIEFRLDKDGRRTE